MIADLCYRDPYKKEWNATVAEVNGDGVRLDKSYFFSRSGGQESDKGKIGKFDVVDVFRDSGKLWQLVPGHKLKPKQKVRCQIDWDRRYMLMKKHTAEHIFFRALSKHMNVELVKIRIGEESSLYIKAKLDWQAIADAELLVNDVIARALYVGISELTKSQAGKKKVRAKFDRIASDEVRVVNIGDFDAAACSGLHVRNTSEIEFFAVTNVLSRGRDTYEIYFEVGKAAMKHVSGLLKGMREAMHLLNITSENFLNRIKNLLDENQKLKTHVASLSSESLSSLKPEEMKEFKLYSAAFSGINRRELTRRAAELINDKKTIVLFLDGDFVILARSDDVKLDCVKLLQKIGKGGGKPGFAMGTTEMGMDKLKSIISDYFSKNFWTDL